MTSNTTLKEEPKPSEITLKVDDIGKFLREQVPQLVPLIENMIYQRITQESQQLSQTGIIGEKRGGANITKMLSEELEKRLRIISSQTSSPKDSAFQVF